MSTSVGQLIDTYVIPLGGIIRLTFNVADAGPWVLTRTVVNQGTNTESSILFSGDPQPRWFDLGDNLNQPLSKDKIYLYTLTTATRSISSLPVSPQAMIRIASEVSFSSNNTTNKDEFGYVFLLKRILEAGVTSLDLPDGWVKPEVMVAMPLTGTPQLPIIAINPDMEQQYLIPIGDGVNTDFTENQYNIEELIKRRVRITVLCMSASEREFYKFAILSIFKLALSSLLSDLGQNKNHSYQMASSQKTGNSDSPGFYFCEIMLEVTGDLNLQIFTSYPPVQDIYTYVTAGGVT